MGDTTWKRFERLVAARFGLKRRGADFGGREGGKSDCVQPDGSESIQWSIECKRLSRPTWQQMVDACAQVERAACDGQEPVVVVGKKGQRVGDALVIQRLDVFEEWRLGR